MNWLDYMNAALDYIEEELSIKIDLDKVASKAGCSTYNFQRMFSFIADVTLATYIRRRCMTKAALDLSKGTTSVMDVALEYGYDSPVSFARAFHSIQGMTPAEATKEGANLKLYSRISFQISIKGDRPMEFKIESKEAFQVAGVSREISTKDGVNFEQVPQMWQDLLHDGTCEKVFSINGKEMEPTYGICYDFAFEQEKFRYMIGIEQKSNTTHPYEVLQIPAHTWVVFRCYGVADIQNVFKRLYTEWFPTSGYEHAGGPEIEWYSAEDMDSPNYHCEVWIPIKPLQK